MGSEVADRKLRLVNVRKGTVEPKRLKKTTLKAGDTTQDVQRALELFLLPTSISRPTPKRSCRPLGFIEPITGFCILWQDTLAQAWVTSSAPSA